MKLIRHFFDFQAAHLTSESGQTMVEYALVLMLISVATVAAFGGLRGAIGGVLTAVAASF